MNSNIRTEKINEIKADETLFLTQPHSACPGLRSLTQTLCLCALGALVSSKPTCRSEARGTSPRCQEPGVLTCFFLDFRVCFMKHTRTYTHSPLLWIAAKSIVCSIWEKQENARFAGVCRLQSRAKIAAFTTRAKLDGPPVLFPQWKPLAFQQHVKPSACKLKVCCQQLQATFKAGKYL